MRRDAADTRMLRALVASASTRFRGFASVAALLSASCATTVREAPVRVAVPAAAPQHKLEATASDSRARAPKRARASRSRPPDPAGFAELGKHLYERQGCSACHSVDGERKIGPSFKGLFDRDETLQDGSVVRVNDDYLRESIVKPAAKVVAGHPPSMPSYGSFLEEPQIRALIAYIVTLQ
jgi:cytochrome c2